MTFDTRLTATVSRRAILATGAGLAAAAVLGGPAFAEVTLDKLMQPGPLPEIVIGKPDAPVTVIEYASMSCPHCAHFHETILPKLKEKYVDTGKVKFYFREFPLNDPAVAGAMLARCAGGSEGPAGMISELFKRQEEWAFVEGDPSPKLFLVAKQAGFTQKSFDDCLTDDKLYKQILEIRQRASKEFGVNATPSFFINGKKFEGSTLADFEKALDPLVKS